MDCVTDTVICSIKPKTGKTEIMAHICYSSGRQQQRNVPERPDGEAALPVAPVTGAVGADDAVLLSAAERLAAVEPGGRGVVEEVDVDVAQVEELDGLLK